MTRYNAPVGEKQIRCAECDNSFYHEELRYRANDGKDYCTDNGCGQKKWAEENGDNRS